MRHSISGRVFHDDKDNKVITVVSQGTQTLTTTTTTTTRKTVTTMEGRKTLLMEQSEQRAASIAVTSETGLC